MRRKRNSKADSGGARSDSASCGIIGRIRSARMVVDIRIGAFNPFDSGG
jgi:hypothetical protein